MIVDALGQGHAGRTCRRAGFEPLGCFGGAAHSGAKRLRSPKCGRFFFTMRLAVVIMKKKVEQGQIVKGYRKDDALRGSFDRLARRTFDLAFEDWYQNGFWGDDYIPYSVVIDGAVAANVSVNRTDFVLGGETKHFIQLGTVMTDERYRNRGLIRRLMAEIDRDFAGRADGVYLFANDSVLNFYPKFGFRRAVEFEYTRAV